MKTPKEVLFEKHATAEWKLDAVRNRALEQVRKPQGVSAWLTLGSLRWHAAALGCLWLVVLALHSIDLPSSSSNDTGTEQMAAQLIWPAQQSETVQELLGISDIAEPQDRDTRPRSERPVYRMA